MSQARGRQRRRRMLLRSRANREARATPSSRARDERRAEQRQGTQDRARAAGRGLYAEKAESTSRRQPLPTKATLTARGKGPPRRRAPRRGISRGRSF